MITHIWDEEQIALRDKRTKSPGFFRPPIDANAPKRIEPDCNPNKSISARIYPNGEFGVGFVPHRGMSAKERKYDSDCRYAEMNAEITADIELINDKQDFIYTRKIIPGFPPPKLGIGAESSQLSKKYGLKGITSYGRKMVRNGGHVLDKAASGQYNRLMQMGTLTVPSYRETTMKNICSHWGDIVRKFYQECKRLYGRYRYRFNYVSVTEIQPGRLQNRHEVGLHLHFLFCAIRLGKGKWVMPDSWVRQTWQRILNLYLGYGEQSHLPNYRRESITRSSAAYLSKYMSKGGEQVHQVGEQFGEDWLPSQWWSMDNATRKCIKAHTISSRTTEAEKLLVIARWGVGQYIRYVRCIELQLHPNEYAKNKGSPEALVLGYGGLLSPDGYDLFAPGNQSESIKKHLPRTLGSAFKYRKKSYCPRLTRCERTSYAG